MDYGLDYVHITPEGVEHKVTLSYTGYYDPGYTSGLPENCYPAEGDMEITSVDTEDGRTLQFDDWVKEVGLSPKEVEAIGDKVMKKLQERRSEPDDFDFSLLW